MERDFAMPDYELQQWRNLFLQIKSQSPTATNLLSAICMLDRQPIPILLFRKEDDVDQDAEAAIDVLTISIFLKENKDENVYVMDPSMQLAIKELIHGFGATDKAEENAL